MYSANVRALLPVSIFTPATLVVGHVVTADAMPAFCASALIAAGVMSGVPTMYSFARLFPTVLRPFAPMTIAVAPKAIRIAAATKPPISNTLRISRLLLCLYADDAAAQAARHRGEPARPLRGSADQEAGSR